MFIYQRTGLLPSDIKSTLYRSARRLRNTLQQCLVDLLIIFTAVLSHLLTKSSAFSAFFYFILLQLSIFYILKIINLFMIPKVIM
jgi:hypothetical protein